jgi:membrane-bound lytic murein transglycosylase MltF
MIAALVLGGVQAAVVSALVVQRPQRRRAEDALRTTVIAVRACSSTTGSVIALTAVALTSCGSEKPVAPPATPQVADVPLSATAAGNVPRTGTADADAPLPESASPYDVLPESLRSAVLNSFTGDLDEMVRRRVIRVGVTFNRTHYFIDKGQQRGLAYESIKLFEDDLNADLKTGTLKVHVAAVPMSRDQLASALLNGKIDMVAAMLTVTPERRALAAFSEPTRTNVSEVVVTGPGAPPIATLDDLAGQEVFVREQSLYVESLVALNEQLKARGKTAVTITPLPLLLEDDDVLEMVNAGLVPITVADDYLAQFWKKVFTGLTVHADVAVRSGGELAIAVRKGNPQLLEVVNAWIRHHGKGDPFRNTIEHRYLESTKFAKNAASDAERRKFLAIVDLFKEYSAQYDLDYLLMAAQGYQESTLDQNARAP